VDGQTKAESCWFGGSSQPIRRLVDKETQKGCSSRKDQKKKNASVLCKTAEDGEEMMKGGFQTERNFGSRGKINHDVKQY